MRARVLGRALAALGGVTLAVAALAPAGSPASAAELPREVAYDTVVVGADVTFLDPVTLEQRSGEQVTVSLRVRDDADPDAEPDGPAIRAYERSTRAADGTLLGTGTTTACLDRRTAEAVDCPAASVDGRPAAVRGLVDVLPPATREQDRMMWDDTVQASFPLRYVGTERFRGLEVQRYEHVVPEQVVRSVTVPGALLGGTGPSAPADVVHSTTRDLLVEPVSGVVVQIEEIPLTRLRGRDGTAGAVLLGGAFRSSEDSVAEAVARTREARDLAAGAPGAVLPWVAGGAGAVLVAGGVLLAARRPARPTQQVPDGPVRQPAPVA
ncbi:porin PorA family protein [Blastococcus sp. SYSU D01042]